MGRDQIYCYLHQSGTYCILCLWLSITDICGNLDDVILQSRRIKSIDLSGTTFDKRGMRYLSQALAASTSLRQVRLDRCALKPALLEIMAGGLRQSTCPLHLSLQYNRISQSGSPWIAAMLLNEEPIEIYWQCGEYMRRGIQTLDLTGNPLRHAIAPLAQALHSNRSLQNLILSDCEIYPAECAILAEALVIIGYQLLTKPVYLFNFTALAL